MSSLDPDVNSVLKGLINTVCEEPVDVKENDGSTNPSSAVDISDFVEMAESESTIQKDDSFENQLEHSRQHKKFLKKKVRSVSESESDIESQTKYMRRKFGSEGEVLSICRKIISPQQEEELNEAIEKYISKLIKDSIFKAERNVTNVSNKLQDTTSHISNRTNSQSGESEEEFIVEQRLKSNSISELVELEDGENENNDDQCDSLLSGFNVQISKAESMENETDEATFRGYLADVDDTTSIDDLKSIEGDSLNNSLNSGLENTIITHTNTEGNAGESNCKIGENGCVQNIAEMNASDTETVKTETANKTHQLENVENETEEDMRDICKSEKNNQSEDNTTKCASDISFQKPPSEREQSSEKSSLEHDQKLSSIESVTDSGKVLSEVENKDIPSQKVASVEITNENVHLIVMSPEEESLLPRNNLKIEENKITPLDLDEGLPQQTSEDEQMKINWKVGNLHVKLPHKTRGKKHLKAWKKRRVVIQPDEFANDPKNPSLVISVYGSDSKKHETTFWYSVSSLKAVIFRSSSRTHRYAFTISEGGQPIIHLSAENETATQEWMAAIRAVLWPPSPFMELEKMLSGREFEVSIVDNEFSYHCGLLGMYGYLSITPKKLILIHPQQGYVIQEWYLNTVDKFHFVPQPKTQDLHKVLCMSTCSDSSTGQGEIIFFCNDSVTLLQSLASSIHEVLAYHSKQEGGKYQKELEEIAEWLVAPPQDCLNVEPGSDEHYKVPPRQVKSLLDIPNFIFNKPLSPVSSAIYPAPNSEVMESLDAAKQTATSHDSGISTCTSSDDFLNCSITSFVIGGGPMTGKSSDSELSDAYTPPRTPEVQKKPQCEVVKEELISAEDG